MGELRRKPGRRIRWAAAAATVATVAGLAVGVGAGPGGAASSSGYDKNGILTYATELLVTGTPKPLDPTKTRAISDFVQMNLVYFTLLQAQDDGTYKPGLATAAKVEGDNAVTITLRPNLKFTDGTPLDATAVKFTIDRNVASKNTNLAPEIANVASVDVIDPLNLKVTLKTPTIGSWYELLAGRETMPVSPTAVNKDPTGFNTAPVGAGPMIVTGNTPGTKIEMRKNPDFYDAKSWKLAGVDFVESAAGASRITALGAGDANFVDLDATQTNDLKSVSNATYKAVSSDANFLYLATCKSKPPFDNLDFRKGVQYALNRDALNQVLVNGQGEPMFTMWPSQSAFFTKSLDNSFAFSVKKAKQEFQKAGWDPNATLQIGYTPTSAQLKTWGETFQSMMGDAGVKVELVPLTDIVTQFYTNVQTPAAVSLWIRPGLQKVTRAFGPNSVANVCQYSDPTLNSYTSQIAALPPGSTQLKKLWDQTNTFITDNLLWNFAAWQPIVVGWNSKEVAGVQQVSPLYQGPNLQTVYIKK